MRAVAILALALGLAPTALATHPGWFFGPRMNLDGDSARERLVATFNTHPDQARVYVLDKCRGRELRHELAAPGIFMYHASIRGSRDLGRPGVLFRIEYEDGHSIARVARLRIQQRGQCPTPVVLFDYSTARPLRPAPGGFVLLDFDVLVHDYSKRYSGPELLLEERYGKASSRRVRSTRYSYFRYSVRSRDYTEYRTVLKRA